MFGFCLGGEPVCLGRPRSVLIRVALSGWPVEAGRCSVANSPGGGGVWVGGWVRGQKQVCAPKIVQFRASFVNSCVREFVGGWVSGSVSWGAQGPTDAPSPGGRGVCEAMAWMRWGVAGWVFQKIPRSGCQNSPCFRGAKLGAGACMTTCSTYVCSSFKAIWCAGWISSPSDSASQYPSESLTPSVQGPLHVLGVPHQLHPHPLHKLHNNQHVVWAV